MSFYREQLNNWLKEIEVRADRVLDIGGGSCPVKGRTKSWNVGEYLILDNEVEEARDGNDIIPYDLNIEQVVVAKADIIFCLEVYEYVYNPVQAMKNIYENLKEGGIAYISFPSQYPLHQPKEIDSLRYTKYGIRKLIQEVGLEIKEIVPRVATAGKEALSSFYRLEGMHPVKGDVSIFDIGYLVKCYKSL